MWSFLGRKPTPKGAQGSHAQAFGVKSCATQPLEDPCGALVAPGALVEAEGPWASLQLLAPMFRTYGTCRTCTLCWYNNTG